MKLFFAWIFIFAGAAVGIAQVASGGNYTLDRSIIAAGGGASQDATGTLYTVNGTIGQSAAGAVLSGGNYTLQSGFQAPAPAAPTAASVTISGRVITPQDFGLTNAFLTLTDMQGDSQTVRTGKTGAYRFTDVAAGETYILSVRSRRYSFVSQVITANGDVTEVNFTALY